MQKSLKIWFIFSQLQRISKFWNAFSFTCIPFFQKDLNCIAYWTSFSVYKDGVGAVRMLSAMQSFGKALSETLRTSPGDKKTVIKTNLGRDKST